MTYLVFQLIFTGNTAAMAQETKLTFQIFRARKYFISPSIRFFFLQKVQLSYLKTFCWISLVASTNKCYTHVLSGVMVLIVVFWLTEQTLWWIHNENVMRWVSPTPWPSQLILIWCNTCSRPEVIMICTELPSLRCPTEVLNGVICVWSTGGNSVTY